MTQLKERAAELEKGLGFTVLPYSTEPTEIDAIHGDAVIVDADDLARVLNPPYHILEVIEAEDDTVDWAVQHPIACRPNILGCSIHQALMEYGSPVGEGRWKLRQSRSGALFAESLSTGGERIR